MKVNYKSDFSLVVQLTAGGEAVAVPTWDWSMIFYTCDRQAVYQCSRIGGVCDRCKVNADGTVTVYFDKHGLRPGALVCEFCNHIPDDNFSFDKRITFDPVTLGVELVRGAGDEGMTPVELELAGDLLAQLQAIIDGLDVATDYVVNLSALWNDEENCFVAPPLPSGPGLPSWATIHHDALAALAEGRVVRYKVALLVDVSDVGYRVHDFAVASYNATAPTSVIKAVGYEDDTDNATPELFSLYHDESGVRVYSRDVATLEAVEEAVAPLQPRLTAGTGIDITNNVISATGGGGGTGIESIEQTVTSDESGGINVVTITMSDSTTADFEIMNGKKGDKGDQGNSGYSGAAGELEVVNNLTDGGETSALSAEMGKVLNEKIENKGDDVYMVTSSSLADAVAEVPSDDRKVGLVIGLSGEGTSVRRYKYMGKYYTDVDWLSEGAWLDLDNAEKYKVYYFRLCPTIEGHEDNASINSSGEVTTGTKHVTDFIAIPESGVSIGGGWLDRYVLYDSGKNKVSNAVLYGGKAFTYSTTESAFIRLEYTTDTPVWLFGYTRGSSSGAPASLPHVEVVENYENLIDYEDNAWAGNVSPFIRLRKGETINLLVRGTDTVATEQYMAVQPYNINQESYGNAQFSRTKYVMPIDGYVKIGSSGAQPAIKNARYNIISKSVARTRAKKRVLVVGDSISVYTWDNTLSKDMKQGYPFFLATQGNHEISVTNQAVSGNTSGAQLTSLQNKDMSVYDVATIFIGTNDYGYNVSVATFKSNIASMVDYITAQNPACKIVFFTLIHRASAWDGTAEVPNATGAVLSDYCTAIKEVAQLHSLPVLDLWNECQCNFNITTYKTNYSSQESEASGDGLHPTNEAHKLFLYPLVSEFLKRLL